MCFSLCVCSAPSAALSEVLSRVDASLWLVTDAQRCPLVRAVYLGVADTLRRFCCETYLSKLSDSLMHDLQTPQTGLQVRNAHPTTSLCCFVCALLTGFKQAVPYREKRDVIIYLFMHTS